LRWYVIVVAYGLVVGIATIAWFYLLSLTLLRAVDGQSVFNPQIGARGWVPR
jgi:hypothetical protein